MLDAPMLNPGGSMYKNVCAVFAFAKSSVLYAPASTL